MSEVDPLKDLTIPNRRSLSEDVLDRLRAAIVRGSLGPGHHLSEAALAETFGVSRGPIREAFAELEREGLLTIERHRGARVTRLAPDDVEEIYQLRRALERLAIERAVRLCEAEDFREFDVVLADLKRAVKEKDVHRVVDLDVAFHDLVYRAARHSRLYLAWTTLRPQIATFLHSRAMDSNDYLKKAVAEHTALRDVIRSKDAPRSIEMIDDHLRTAYERLSQLAAIAG
jgi:DNA-binding GntR family transcriptional regulator